MKKNRYILAGLTAATLLATACSEIDDDQLQQEQTVPVTFYLRSAGPNTRATEDIKTGTDAENAIHSAKVWLYQSAYTEGTTTHDPLLLGYQDASFSGTANVREITINIPKAVADAGRKLDVYAIANTASVGLGEMNAGSNEAPKTFDNVYLAGTNFTPKTLTASPGVPNEGLPMSQIAKNQDIIPSGTGAPYTLNKIDLVRAISKIRFAFARTTGLVDVEVTGIEVNGNIIPKKERIFPNQDATNYGEYDNITYNGDRYTNIVKTGTDATDYEQAKLIYDNSATAGDFTATLIPYDLIQQFTDPRYQTFAEKSSRENYTAAQYDAFITNSVIGNAYNFDTYLRESDRPVTGKIYFRLSNDGAVKSIDFSTAAPSGSDTSEDFARNHIYTVYAWFEGTEMKLRVEARKWNTFTENFNFSENVVVTEQIEWDRNSIEGTDEVVVNNQYDHTNVYMDSQKTAVCTFTFDAPKGGTFYATLVPIEGDEDAITFEDGTTMTSGPIGRQATLKFKVRNANNPDHRNVALLKFVVYGPPTEEDIAAGRDHGSQSYEVKKLTIGQEAHIIQPIN